MIVSSRPYAPMAALAALLAGVALAGCSATDSAKPQSGGPAPAEITVDASDSACTLSANRAGTGKHTFVVTNNGAKVTEFYIYGKDDRVLAEVENISPGLQRRLEVDFTEPGTYQAACKPGMIGDGIRTDVTVTG